MLLQRLKIIFQHPDQLINSQTSLIGFKYMYKCFLYFSETYFIAPTSS